jgi:hypothetical protein
MEKETCERKGPCILGINVGLGIKGSTPMLLCLERIKISKAIEEEIVGTESQGGKTTKRTIKGQTTRYHRTEKEKGKKEPDSNLAGVFKKKVTKDQTPTG